MRLIERRLIHFFDQQQHVNRCLGSLCSLITDLPPSSLNGLIHCIACQYAKGDGYLVVERESCDGVADRRINMLIVGSFASDHAAERENRVKSSELK